MDPDHDAAGAHGAVEAFDRGWHLMCEKPRGLTARASGSWSGPWKGCAPVTAENYRRDR